MRKCTLLVDELVKNSENLSGTRYLLEIRGNNLSLRSPESLRSTLCVRRTAVNAFKAAELSWNLERFARLTLSRCVEGNRLNL